jgi:hypothetical protein
MRAQAESSLLRFWPIFLTVDRAWNRVLVRYALQLVPNYYLTQRHFPHTKNSVFTVKWRVQISTVKWMQNFGWTTAWVQRACERGGGRGIVWMKLKFCSFTQRGTCVRCNWLTSFREIFQNTLCGGKSRLIKCRSVWYVQLPLMFKVRKRYFTEM